MTHLTVPTASSPELPLFCKQSIGLCAAPLLCVHVMPMAPAARSAVASGLPFDPVLQIRERAAAAAGPEVHKHRDPGLCLRMPSAIPCPLLLHTSATPSLVFLLLLHEFSRFISVSSPSNRLPQPASWWHEWPRQKHRSRTRILLAGLSQLLRA